MLKRRYISAVISSGLDTKMILVDSWLIRGWTCQCIMLVASVFIEYMLAVMENTKNKTQAHS